MSSIDIIESENSSGGGLFRIKLVRCVIYNFAMESFGFATFTNDKNSRESFNLQRSKGTTRICSSKLFELSTFSFVLYFFYFSSVPTPRSLVVFDILFSFLQKKKKDTEKLAFLDEDLSKRRFENVWMCRVENFKWQL